MEQFQTKADYLNELVNIGNRSVDCGRCRGDQTEDQAENIVVNVEDSGRDCLRIFGEIR